MQRILTFVALFALAGGLLTGAALAAKQRPPTPVFVTEATPRTVSDRIEALGTLRARESVVLTALVTETISKLHFDDGDRVQADQVLVEMTSEQERALIREARATLAESRQQYDRIKSLSAVQKASKSLLDERRRQLETARARLAALESSLQDRVIRAPFAGVVGLRQVSRGALVEPGDVITSLDDDSVMKLDFPVPALHLGALAPGLDITGLTPAWPERTFKGRVTGIDSRVDPVTRTAIVRAVLDNPGHLLRPGMLMQVEIVSRPRDAIVIPEECLLPTGGRQYVLVVDADGTARKREIRIGSRMPGGVEVVSGLAAGERVVTDGGFKVRAGSKVKVRAADDGTASLRSLLGEDGAARTPR